MTRSPSQAVAPIPVPLMALHKRMAGDQLNDDNAELKSSIQEDISEA
jgi:hypothetical protein